MYIYRSDLIADLRGSQETVLFITWVIYTEILLSQTCAMSGRTSTGRDTLPNETGTKCTTQYMTR